MASATSFSFVPSSPTVPLSWPPWPGSMTTRRNLRPSCSARVTSLAVRLPMARSRSRTCVGGAMARSAPASGVPEGRIDSAAADPVPATGRFRGASDGAAGRRVSGTGSAATGGPEVSSSSSTFRVSSEGNPSFSPARVVTSLSHSGVSTTGPWWTAIAGAERPSELGWAATAARDSPRLAAAVRRSAAEDVSRLAALPDGRITSAAVSRGPGGRASAGVSRFAIASPFPAFRDGSFGSGGSEAVSARRRAVWSPGGSFSARWSTFRAASG